MAPADQLEGVRQICSGEGFDTVRAPSFICCINVGCDVCLLRAKVVTHANDEFQHSFDDLRDICSQGHDSSIYTKPHRVTEPEPPASRTAHTSS